MRGLLARVGLVGTKVGRRYLLLFLVAAMAPALLLTLTGGWYVRSMLEEQAREGMLRLAKSVSLSLLASLTSSARDARAAAVLTGTRAPESLRLGLVDEFIPTSQTIGMPQLTDDERAHLSAGRVLLRLRQLGRNSELLLGIADGSSGSSARTRWFIVSPQVLWSPVSDVVNGEGAELCVFEAGSLRRIRCTDGITPKGERSARVAAHETAEGRGVTEIGDWVIATRDIFLRFDLGASSWRLVTLKSRQSTLAAASGYTSTAALLLLTALVLVFVLSHAQIRRSTVPLQQLRDASTRVAEGHLDARIEVRGNDEYAEVGAAFNGMTIALQQQVRLLQGMEAIDRSVLATREISDLVEVTLSELAEVHRDGVVALLVRRALSTDVADLWWRNLMDRRRQRASVTLLAGESAELLTSGLALLVPGTDQGRAYVTQSRGGALDAPSLVLPLRHAGELIGAVILHGAHRGADEGWTRGVVARLAERVALALANVRLVDRLEVLSVGTLSAFARTIETNSVWSAGHAERVTALAMVLGRRMGVSAAAEDALHRGGLLHDIGKIGIPSSVLDKPGRLDANEAALMRRHPELGERILQPIPAFADVLPIVRSHHERLDGSGYPDGLRGSAIDRLARIVAVADVYDALTFDRPYRNAYLPEDAVTHLLSHPDKFEPEVLDALRLVARDDLLQGRPVWRDALSPIRSEDALTALPLR